MLTGMIKSLSSSLAHPLSLRAMTEVVVVAIVAIVAVVVAVVVEANLTELLANLPSWGVQDITIK